MKKTVRIKGWQLLRYRDGAPVADLREAEFVAVGPGAFRGGVMEELLLPVSMTTVKARALEGCRRLRTVRVPAEGNVGFSAEVFRGCERLQQIDGFERVVSVGDGALRGCALLRDVTFGKSLRRIGAGAFRGCRSLLRVELPATLGELGKGAFRDCSELTSVSLAPNMTACAEELFRGCLSLQTAWIPTAWLTLPRGTFRDCTALSEVEIPGTAVKLGAHVFRGCTRLETVSLQLGVQSIGAHAFDDDPALREVYVPHSLKSLGFGAFGTGERSEEEKILLYVENEYMARRLRRLVLLCGSRKCVRIEVTGKSIEERKRERRRASLSMEPAHLVDFSQDPLAVGATDPTEPTDPATTDAPAVQPESDGA